MITSRVARSRFPLAPGEVNRISMAPTISPFRPRSGIR